jgi:hypothetical protein
MRKRGEESTRNAFIIIRIMVTGFIINKMRSVNDTGLRDMGLNEVVITINGILMA